MTMTKKEQFERLCAGHVGGPVLFRPILMHFAARFIGDTYGRFASDYKVLVESNLKCMDYFETDMVGLISDPYRETAAFGAKVSFPAEEVPRCEQTLIKTYEDVKNLKRPDVCKCGRTLDRIRGAELFQKELKGTVPVIGWIEGPLAEACDLTGISNMLVQLMMDIDFSNLLLDKCTQTAKDFAKAQIEAGCDIIGIGDAICSQIDEMTYDMFIKERHREIISYIHGLGAKVKLHICGNITHLLPYLKGLKLDILDVDYMVSMDEAYEIVGPDVIRCGNINPVDIQFKTAGEIERMTKDLLEKEKGRKFILSAGCEITVSTPFENLLSMRKVSK
jgi:MtaA/CmuA family methyltransferase